MPQKTSTNYNLPRQKYQFFIVFLSAFTAVKKDYDYLRKLISLSKKISIETEIVYESLLQVYLFAGFPTALNALKILNHQSQNDHPKFESDLLRAEGIKNCKKVYGSKTENLLSNIKLFSTDLAEWLILEGYGKVYSRNTLTLTERELSAVAALIPLRFDDQLISHLHGLIKSKFPVEIALEFFNSLKFIGYKHDGEYVIELFTKVIEKKK